MIEKTRNGWVIVNVKHPNAPGKVIVCNETFSYRRSDSITKFCKGSGSEWHYWYRKYNFRAVKAEISIKAETPK